MSSIKRDVVNRMLSANFTSPDSRLFIGMIKAGHITEDDLIIWAIEKGMYERQAESNNDFVEQNKRVELIDRIYHGNASEDDKKEFVSLITSDQLNDVDFNTWAIREVIWQRACLNDKMKRNVEIHQIYNGEEVPNHACVGDILEVENIRGGPKQYWRKCGP